MEVPAKQFSEPLKNEVPAQDLQNLSPEQSKQIIENTDGMEEAIGEVENLDEVNFDDPDLQLDDKSKDPLENDIYDKAFGNLDETQTDALAAISKNISPETVLRRKTQKKEFLAKFNGDAQKLQAEINKLKNHEKTVFTAEEIQNLQKLSKLSKLEHRDNHSPDTLKHGKIKIAKIASNTARTTAVAEFMKTVASSLTSRVGDTNL